MGSKLTGFENYRPAKSQMDRAGSARNADSNVGMNRVRHNSIRFGVYEWETEKAWIWQDDAACAFQPPTLFEVAFEGDPVAEGLAVNEIKDLNAANLEAAKKICDSCPVRHLCYSNSSEDDFQFTMRAGIMPLRYNETPQGRPRKDAEPAPKVDACKRGHEDWTTKNGRRRCRTCINISQRDRAAKAKKGKPDGRSKPSNARTLDSVCPTCGGQKWMARKDGGLRCQPCSAEQQRIRRGSGRAARIRV